MPKVMVIGPYEFFFYSNEGTEPPHVHVRREDKSAKFWLEPVGLAGAQGFAGRETRLIARLVAKYREGLREAWDEFFTP